MGRCHMFQQVIIFLEHGFTAFAGIKLMSFDAVSFETVESVEGCSTYRALEHCVEMNRSQVSLQ